MQLLLSPLAFISSFNHLLIHPVLTYCFEIFLCIILGLGDAVVQKAQLLAWSFCSTKSMLLPNVVVTAKPVKAMVQGQKTLSWSQKSLASKFRMTFLGNMKNTSSWCQKCGSVIMNHHPCGPRLPQLCEIHDVFHAITCQS